MSEFRDKAGEIRALGGSILGMSVESDRAHKAYGEHLRLDFPLLSDFNRVVVGKYGIAYDEANARDGKWGMSKRSMFVIAQDGTIRYKWVTDDAAIAPNVEQVLDCLREIRASAGRGGDEGSTE